MDVISCGFMRKIASKKILHGNKELCGILSQDENTKIRAIAKV